MASPPDFPTEEECPAAVFHNNAGGYPTIRLGTGATVIHEFGHALGLAHPGGRECDGDYSTTIMREPKACGTRGCQDTRVHMSDQTAIRFLYGP